MRRARFVRRPSLAEARPILHFSFRARRSPHSKLPREPRRSLSIQS